MDKTMWNYTQISDRLQSKDEPEVKILDEPIPEINF